MKAISISVAANSHPFSSPFLLFSSPNCTPKYDHGRATQAAASSPLEGEKENKRKIEIRVCANRTCRKQGSLEIFQVLSGIAPPHVSVNSCGCLGRCGVGPNVVVLPEGVFVGHCGTPTKASDMTLFVCGVDGSEVETSRDKCLKALALRKRAEDETSLGNFSQANNLLSQVCNKTVSGRHNWGTSRCCKGFDTRPQIPRGLHLSS